MSSHSKVAKKLSHMALDIAFWLWLNRSVTPERFMELIYPRGCTTSPNRGLGRRSYQTEWSWSVAKLLKSLLIATHRMTPITTTNTTDIRTVDRRFYFWSSLITSRSFDNRSSMLPHKRFSTLVYILSASHPLSITHRFKISLIRLILTPT